MISREKLLEVLAFWRTRVTAKDVADVLGGERTHIQRAVMKPFKREFPDVMREKRRGILQAGMTLDEPVIADQDLRSLFHLLSAVKDFGTARPGTRTSYGIRTILGFPIEEVRVPDRGEHSKSRFVVAAAGLGLAVVGDYAFKRRGVIRVRFTPKVMIQTPSRMVFRGYLETDSGEGWEALGYRNIYPSRFYDIEEIVDAVAPNEADHAWNTSVTLKFRLNPMLPATVRRAFALEHGLEVDASGDYIADIITTDALVFLYRDEVYVRRWGDTSVPVWLETF